ncbi:hypothetical protein [Geminocystis sp.]|uniref:hypothetical protein n=1 Tax=Geminocystis sp. TaxID=2664100 RepID=UPI003594467C
MSIIISLSSTNILKAETLPSAEEFGNFFGSYFCQSLTDSAMKDKDKVMEEFSEDLINKYGEQNITMLTDKLSKLGEDDSLNEDYNISFMKAMLNKVINNDVCLKGFMKEMFEK